MCSYSVVSFSQTQTVGIFLNTPESFDGYTLLDPLGSSNTYLIDNCGQVINTWTSDYVSGGACYLLEDGSLVRGCRVNGSFFGGGVGGRLERLSWDNDLLWSLDWADEEKHHHHDFAWMPNGHVLVLAWELRSAAEAGAAGRINPQTMWPESVTEISPTSPSGGEVVWEWHAWDHLVQNADSTLPQFGQPSDYPRKIDVNYAIVGGGGGPGGANSGDWMHANAVNYNAALDQIAISSRRFNEMWVIDHNTTSEEATGLAGDLLYRFGNPAAYGRGAESDQIFFGQHDVQWIPEDHPQAGDFAIYNNGDTRPGCMCSTIDVWTPPIQTDGTYELEGEAAWGPEALEWNYPETPATSFFSPNISGVQPQPNGNYLICEGAGGRLFEVTQEGAVVWEYVNPEGNFGISPQGSDPQQNGVFRAYRYGPDYPGFQGRDMTPGEPLEGANWVSCELFVVADTTATNQPELFFKNTLVASPNPTSGILNVTFPASGTWSLLDISGRKVENGRVSAPSRVPLNFEAYQSGVWILLFQNDKLSKPHRLRIVLN
ncbi:MAG: aryl-sulfate sulfotransferase [Flavobacteriales bacterium]